MISPICGESCFTVKTADFCRVPSAGVPDDLRTVCGVSVVESSNLSGLDRTFCGKMDYLEILSEMR